MAIRGAAVGAFFMFLFSLEPGRDEVKRSKPEEQKRTACAAAEAPGGMEPAKPKYDFYTLLPESEVIVPPDALPPADGPKLPEQKLVTPEEAAKIDAARAEAALNGQTPPPPPVVVTKAPVTTQFFLQAGSFRKREDADKVRACRSSCSARTCRWSRARCARKTGSAYWSAPTPAASSWPRRRSNWPPAASAICCYSNT